MHRVRAFAVSLVNWIYRHLFTAKMLLEPESCFVSFHLPKAVIPAELSCGNESLQPSYFSVLSWSSL